MVEEGVESRMVLRAGVAVWSGGYGYKGPGARAEEVGEGVFRKLLLETKCQGHSHPSEPSASFCGCGFQASEESSAALSD